MENNLDGCQLVAFLRTLLGSLLGLDITSSSTRLLDAATAATLLGMSKRWLYEHADRLPFTRRIGRTLRFDETGLRDWAHAHQGNRTRLPPHLPDQGWRDEGRRRLLVEARHPSLLDGPPDGGRRPALGCRTAPRDAVRPPR